MVSTMALQTHYLSVMSLSAVTTRPHLVTIFVLVNSAILSYYVLCTLSFLFDSFKFLKSGHNFIFLITKMLPLTTISIHKNLFLVILLSP